MYVLASVVCVRVSALCVCFVLCALCVYVYCVRACVRLCVRTVCAGVHRTLLQSLPVCRYLYDNHLTEIGRGQFSRLKSLTHL